MADAVLKWCPGCDEVSRWEPHEEECDICGEELCGDGDGVEGIDLLIRTHVRADKAEASLDKVLDNLQQMMKNRDFYTEEGIACLAEIREGLKKLLDK